VRTAETVYVVVHLILFDMVKAELREPQFPASQSAGLTATTVKGGFHRCAEIRGLGLRKHPSDEHQAVSLGKGMNGAPKSDYRTAPTECGMTYGTRVLWSRSFDSSQRAGKPFTRRSEAGCSHALLPRGARDA
jgi:hypothetical protein